jgi:hypothetical protein
MFVSFRVFRVISCIVVLPSANRRSTKQHESQKNNPKPNHRQDRESKIVHFRSLFKMFRASHRGGYK